VKVVFCNNFLSLTPNPIEMKKIKTYRPSGLILGILIGAASVFAIQSIQFSNKLAAGLLPGPNTTVCNLPEMPVTNPMTGILATEEQFNAAVSAYQQAHPVTDPAATWGGMIGKNHLIAIINSLGPNATEVNFKFITNSGNNKTSLFFQGGMFNPVTGELGVTKLFIRTGSASDAFCPPRCN
jgi:hypothetical protein